ncbi:MAG: hypothetical protein DRR04_14330 [Gammaproteobacteria bacterium]|nr:MAG: hypothetical protein DRR04_14330 [Gammaproteobacteria bacterium]
MSCPHDRGIFRGRHPVGFALQVAQEGGETLELSEFAPPDSVPTDCNTPHLCGPVPLDATGEHWPGTAVVIHTGCGVAQSTVSGTRGGAAHFIAKSFDNDVFVAGKRTRDPDNSMQTDPARRVFGERLV